MTNNSKSSDGETTKVCFLLTLRACCHPSAASVHVALGHPGRERLRLCSFIVVQAGERKHSELHTGSHSFHLKATHGFAAGHVTTRNSREGKKCNRSCTQTLKGWDSPAKSNNDHCRRAGHSPWLAVTARSVLSHALVCSAGCTVFFFFGRRQGLHSTSFVGKRNVE